jgi:hypothetical protein
MDFLQKYVGGIFKSLTPRNAQKRANDISRKKIGGWVVWSGI